MLAVVFSLVLSAGIIPVLVAEDQQEPINYYRLQSTSTIEISFMKIYQNYPPHYDSFRHHPLLPPPPL